jgi:F-box/leucine-rich repeat protein 14
VTDEGIRAVSICNALTSLNLYACYGVTDAGVRALSSLPALTSLDLRYCYKVTAAGVQALRNTTAAPSLHIDWGPIEEEDWRRCNATCRPAHY